MIKLTLFIFVATIISTGYLQEISNSLFPPKVSNDNTGSQLWSYQGYQGQRRSKPCPKRRYKNGEEEQWIPSYSSRITKPRYETAVLQPQALKNDEVIEFNPDAKTANDQQLSVPERRAFEFKPANLNEDDCIDYLESTNEKPFNPAKAEEAAIKIIKDCLKRKENVNSLPALGSSRRSMSDLSNSDYLDKDKNNNYPRVTDASDPNLLDDVNNVPQDSNTDTSRDATTQNDSEDKSDNKLTSKLMDPVKGTGFVVGPTNNIFLKDPRVCYACSTATNPSCWEPDRWTTVKYCPKEQSCVTKSFGVKNSLTVIRDCANSCEDSSLLGIEPKFKSCKLCHSDYCNGAISINTYNLVIVLVITIAKCIF